MKQKVLTVSVVIIAILALILLTGCGNSSNTNDTNNTNNSVKSEAFFNMMKDRTYHMQGKSIIEGTVFDIVIYAKGNMASVVMVANGQVVIDHIMRDGKTYILNSATKTITATALTDEDFDDQIGTSGASYTKSGTDTFNGESLSYDEYTDVNGVKIQFFMKDDTLAGIRRIEDGVVDDTIVSIFDQNISDNMFELPSDYQIVEQ